MQRIALTLLAIAACCPAIHAAHTEPSDSLEKELHEVIVTARQPATKLEGTTLVSTIPGTTLQHLGTALDVLRQLPMIRVEDESVSIIGKGTPEILIDGRPMRSADELIHLSSSGIRKVELDMAPGAMYDSATRAVLRITTRRSFLDGISLSNRAEATQRRRLSANDYLDLNYHSNAWDIFLSGGVNHSDILTKGYTTNSLEYTGQHVVIGSSQHSSSPATVGAVTAGVNYSADSQAFGAYYRINPEHGDFQNDGSEWIDHSSPIHRIIRRRIRARSHLVQLYYDNTFATKYHTHFDGNFKNSHATNHVLTSYPDAAATADVSSSDSRRSSLWAGKLYVEFPLAKGKVTAGTQDSYTRTTLDYLMLNPDISQYIPSYTTVARQTLASAFAAWSRSFGRVSLSAGLRYEYADYLYNVNGVKDSDISRTHSYLTPDISLGYSFSDDSQLSVSYKMSTVKPPYAQLTGSLSYVGMHEIEGGNPALKDERMHDLQLFAMHKGFMLQADYTRSIDTYAYVKRLYPAPTLQLLMQPVNIDVSALSLYLVWSKPVRAWTPNLTVGMYKQWLRLGGTHYNRPILSYYFDNTFALPADFIFTLNATGQTAGYMHTNRFASTPFSLDASISKSFLGKDLQLKLSATDIFNTSCNDWTMTTYGVHVSKHQSYDSRGISLSLIYRFRQRPSQYKGTSASDTELRRL
ncbi:MAG: TonB-dependent receptor [Muribaculaceae bacterium]|nr:TonB-dependent receptor [Muribaculaceae bacterium]